MSDTPDFELIATKLAESLDPEVWELLEQRSDDLAAEHGSRKRG